MRALRFAALFVPPLCVGLVAATAQTDWGDAMRTVSRRAALTGLALFALWPGPAGAQEQTLKIVYPYPAGGSADAVARMLADHLQKNLGRTVIVENRTGAGGRIGLRAVKEAATDGATLLFIPGGPITTHPHVYPNLGYDPL